MQNLATPTVLLEVKNLVKQYEKTTAVNNISLQIPTNTIFGLLGPNGAGKTTLIRMITNILIPDKGTVNLISTDKKHLQSRYIGYMPEERGLYKKMKVGEHLLYLAQLKNLSYKEALENVHYWLNKFDISSWWNKTIEELSKGMHQKIQFIAAVVHKPHLIILDEPFSGLDPLNSEIIKNEIFNLKQQPNTAILFSTHRMEQVEEICENIALINKGSIILEGNVKQLKNQFKQNHFEIQYTESTQINENWFNINPIFTKLHHNINQNTLIVQLNEPYLPNDILKELIANQILITNFKEIMPSLNQIFIQQVTANNDC